MCVWVHHYALSKAKPQLYEKGKEKMENEAYRCDVTVAVVSPQSPIQFSLFVYTKQKSTLSLHPCLGVSRLIAESYQVSHEVLTAVEVG